MEAADWQERHGWLARFMPVPGIPEDNKRQQTASSARSRLERNPLTTKRLRAPRRAFKNFVVFVVVAHDFEVDPAAIQYVENKVELAVPQRVNNPGVIAVESCIEASVRQPPPIAIECSPSRRRSLKPAMIDSFPKCAHLR
jgi:hypothetical protein